MSSNYEKSVLCVAVTYVGPFEIRAGVAHLELILQLIDGTEVNYLVPRPVVRALMEGCALAESLARS